jgi:hypothetical protein
VIAESVNLQPQLLKSQTEAAGDFDIEWANNPGTFPWQIKQLERISRMAW